MSLGLIGKKLGMTRIYLPNGKHVPVTVVDVKGNQVLQVKRASGKDGYNAAQVGYDEQKPQRLTGQVRRHIERWGGTAKKRIREFRFKTEDGLPEPGTVIGTDVFPEGSWVDVTGTSKGKGFQGVMKRYGFAGQPQSHGSMMHRRPGSIGCRLTPGLVWKNQKMPGRMGGKRRTVQSLKVMQSRAEDGVLVIAGSIPGPRKGYVIIRSAVRDPATHIARAEANKAKSGKDTKGKKK